MNSEIKMGLEALDNHPKNGNFIYCLVTFSDNSGMIARKPMRGSESQALEFVAYTDVYEDKDDRLEVINSILENYEKSI